MIALDTNVLIYACDKSDPARQQIALDLVAWDAMILSACVDAGVTLFYSEDLPGGAISDVQVVNPFK